ncbi:uncharacterized protein METZ01_LOCUS485221, partial [marine metagenome]
TIYMKGLTNICLSIFALKNIFRTNNIIFAKKKIF